MSASMKSPTVEGVTHHTVAVNGTELHYTAAGTTGTPILLVHGFPESWWAFHRLMPLLAARHRVFAVDLRGFGDSSPAADDHDSATSAADLHALIAHLDVGPVHLTSQDISGAVAFRLAAAHPEVVRSFTAIETGLPGFGFEAFADVAHGGIWYIGVLATPGLPELLFAGRERELLGEWLFPRMTSAAGSITDADLDEFTRAYSRPHAWRGPVGIYRSMLAEGDELRTLAQARPLTMPVLAIDAASGPFTSMTMRQVAAGDITAVTLDGVGHCVALEAPDVLAASMLEFLHGVDAGASVVAEPVQGA